jgi:hypothetical protein
MGTASKELEALATTTGDGYRLADAMLLGLRSRRGVRISDARHR